MSPALTLIEKALALIKAREEKANNGGWYWDKEGNNWLMSPERTIISASHDNGFVSNVGIKENNAEFIAHSRTDIPALVKAVEIAVSSMRSACYCFDTGDKCEHCADLDALANILEVVK